MSGIQQNQLREQMRLLKPIGGKMGDYHTRIINGIEYAYDGDTRIGKLYDTFGHEETLNVFGPNVKIKDGAGFSDKRPD